MSPSWLDKFDSTRCRSSAADFRYRVFSVLYRGSRSDVYLAKHIDNMTKVCLKSIRCSDTRGIRVAQNELVAAFGTTKARSSCAEFVHVSEWFWNGSSGIPAIILVMEPCDMSLEDFLAKVKFFAQSERRPHAVSLSVVAELMCDMLRAVLFLETVKVVHQDVKSSNILWKRASAVSGVWKLSDFGSIRCFADKPTRAVHRRANFTGTVFTASPESLRCEWSRIGSSSDTWSLGCVIWEVVCLQRPFLISDLLYFQNSSLSSAEFPIAEYISRRTGGPSSHRRTKILAAVRAKLLITDPSKRPLASYLIHQGFVDSLVSPIDLKTVRGMTPFNYIAS